MLHNYDETAYRWSRISVYRKAGLMIFWFGIATLAALFFWSVWAAASAVLEWAAAHGWN